MELREVGIYWSEFQRGRGVPSWNGENSRGFGAVGDSRALQEVGMSNIPSPGGGKALEQEGKRQEEKRSGVGKGKLQSWRREKSGIGEGKIPELEKEKIQNWRRERSRIGKGKDPDLEKGKIQICRREKIWIWRRERSRVGEGKDPELEKANIWIWGREKFGFGEGKDPDLEEEKKQKENSPFPNSNPSLTPRKSPKLKRF